MKMNKIIGILLLALAVGTIVGRVLNNDAYWDVYNYATLLVSVVGGGILLLKQK